VLIPKLSGLSRIIRCPVLNQSRSHHGQLSYSLRILQPFGLHITPFIPVIN
jgi:hypothetical protein